jgi:hypothetical protein
VGRSKEGLIIIRVHAYGIAGSGRINKRKKGFYDLFGWTVVGMEAATERGDGYRRSRESK